jgi:dihydroorotate dehydrogenase
MYEFWISVRNGALQFFYKQILKRIFFLGDPEDVHDHMTSMGKWLGGFGLGRWKTKFWFGYQNSALEQIVAGIHFKNPIGLAAGFDKDAQLTQILPSVGFGFEEVGSVTGDPCPGNPRPRLWRLKKSQSLMVYYGLKNEGCVAIAHRIKDLRFKIPVGISIAKTNSPKTAEEQAGIADYVKAYKTFVDAGVGDYFTINISCPNAFGGEPFTTPEKFDRLMFAIREVKSEKPVFIKMPAELPFSVVDEMVGVARKYRVTGFICTNLAKDRNNPAIKDSNVPEHGGMSGKVVQDLSDKLISHLYKTTKEFVIIGCGGVFSAEDAYRKIKLGASLIQMITGMIFEGPQVISEINRGISNLLSNDGYKNISEAVGKGL